MSTDEAMNIDDDTLITFFVKITNKNKAFMMKEKAKLSFSLISTRIHTTYKRLYNEDLFKPYLFSKMVKSNLIRRLIIAILLSLFN